MLLQISVTCWKHVSLECVQLLWFTLAFALSVEIVFVSLYTPPTPFLPRSTKHTELTQEEQVHKCFWRGNFLMRFLRLQNRTEPEMHSSDAGYGFKVKEIQHEQKE